MLVPKQLVAVRVNVNTPSASHVPFSMPVFVLKERLPGRNEPDLHAPIELKEASLPDTTLIVAGVKHPLWISPEPTTICIGVEDSQ